jgi:hypothetical protein
MLHPLAFDLRFAVMIDFIFVAAGIGFFAAACLYLFACDLPEERVRALVADATEDRFLRILGETRVNVLKLNLALDAVK